VRIPLASTLSREQALLLLRGDEAPFALVGEWAGVAAILGSTPCEPLAPVDRDAVVGGGWFGVLGYQLGEEIEWLPAPPPAPVSVPASRVAFYDHVVVHDGSQWWFESLVPDHPRLELWRRRLASGPPAPQHFAAGSFAPRAPGAAGLLWAVEECVRKITEGELFQANLTLRLEADFAGSELDVFAAALPRARPRFGACFPGVVSLSPERFLRRAGRRVETDPIKGTSTDPTALAESAKDAAEHVMIVDLMRNDLGRVCEYGSVVAHPPRLEAHANVWHMVSTVSGDLRPEVTDLDLLAATFPPGSVTGAPKVQAMKVISELEPTRREAYTGAIGYASPLAGLELSVAIRTFEIADGRIWLGAGGGIVADSQPETELDEALTKAAGPLSAAHFGLSSPMGPILRSDRLPKALDHGPRPDPALGLLETVLVDGEPVALDAHLSRMAASAGELYGIELPADLRERCDLKGSGRLRITLTPNGVATVELLPLADIAPPARLVPYVLPGGLGRHKWADRRLATALGRDAVLIDADGAVLEATWANVVIEEDGELVTPPADGRILPGIRRATLQAREESFGLDRLERVTLTSALRAQALGRTSAGTSPPRLSRA
jgi:para-aminobenzoate synthetase/4-amino-4-deoxychorismate lyase